MTDREELEAALAAAAAGKRETDTVAAGVRAAGEGIRRIVEPNGYVSRFREMVTLST